MFEPGVVSSTTESEAFYYRYMPWGKINIAAHYKIAQTTSDSLESQYFLGGFDSIRGLPDGALFGNRAAYGNFELRRIMFKSRYLWLQSVLFSDFGGAGRRWQQAKDSARSSAGVGLRISVPQIHRLILRLDYAWSLDRPGTSGFSAGMNELFQPYKPL